MHVRVGAVPLGELGDERRGRTSAEIRTEVERARAVQRARYGKSPGVTCNAHAGGRLLGGRDNLTSEAKALLHSAVESLALSARGYHRVVRLARTIADLESERLIKPAHIAEALRYRPASARGGEGSPP
jgi:magnesium chelatase family protein